MQHSDELEVDEGRVDRVLEQVASRGHARVHPKKAARILEERVLRDVAPLGMPVAEELQLVGQRLVSEVAAGESIEDCEPSRRGAGRAQQLPMEEPERSRIFE